MRWDARSSGFEVSLQLGACMAGCPHGFWLPLCTQTGGVCSLRCLRRASQVNEKWGGRRGGREGGVAQGGAGGAGGGGVAGGDEPRSKERLRAGLNGSEWVGRSYVFYPVTPSTSGRCRGGKERPARPPPASSHEPHVLDNARAAAKCPPPLQTSGPQVSAAAASFPRKRGWQRSQSPAQLGGGHGSWKEPGSWRGGGKSW